METTPKEQKRWMTVYDVADELEVSDWTVRRMIDRGELPAKKIGKKPLIEINRGEFQARLARTLVGLVLRGIKSGSTLLQRS